MRIYNGQLFINKRFVDGSIDFDGNITALGAPCTAGDLNAAGGYVVPGFVDIHTHGAVNADASDGSAEGLAAMADHYAAHGVTAFLATTMTLPEAQLAAAVGTVRDFRYTGGARCAGIHLEGPFLSRAKKGAQAEENLRAPDLAMFHRLYDRSGGGVKLITVAPEEPGGLAFIREASRSCVVSIGHTTADYDTAMAAFDGGATHATHLYNGMPGLHHRAPAVIGAALDSGASVELICDGFHIHPAVIRATHRMFGEKLNLISDSMRCAGMPDGFYDLGGQRVTVKGGRATLPDGTIAGSSISLLDAVRNVVRFGLPLEDALYAAAAAPADAAGLSDVGRLAVGKRADLLVLGQDLSLRAVFVGGKRIV